MDNTERLVTVTHAMKVRDSLRYCAGVFDGEECNACDYEGCTTELMLDAAHNIDHLLEEIHDLEQEIELALRAVEELSSDIEKRGGGVYHYKMGDICPFCGKPITTTDPTQLETISLAAWKLQLPSPDAPLPEYRCLISNCPREGKASKNAHCCQSCDARLTCPYVCYNRPDRCGCAAEIVTDEEAD